MKLITIKGFDSFGNIYKSGRRFRVKNITAVVVFASNAKNNAGIVQLGVVVGKKTAKKAVIRNRIKRLMRASLYNLFDKTPELFVDIDKIVFSYFAAPAHPKLITFEEVIPVLKDILEQVSLYRSYKI